MPVPLNPAQACFFSFILVCFLSSKLSRARWSLALNRARQPNHGLVPLPVSILGSLPESPFLLPLLGPWYSNLSVCTSGHSHFLTLRPPGKALMSIMSHPATQKHPLVIWCPMLRLPPLPPMSCFQAFLHWSFFKFNFGKICFQYL